MTGGEGLPGNGRFELQRRLGEGGFGTVYAAFDRELRIPVALKKLRNSSGDSLYRFKQEFRSLAGVVHPNLVSLYELFQVNEQWYFTMELVQGRHLFDYLRPGQSIQSADTMDVRTRDTLPCEMRPGGKPVPLPDLTTLRNAFCQLAQAMRALHEAGLLHRDVKSSNVLVTEEGRVVVLDFGLVTQVFLPSDGEVVGTPHYMAPEQWLGGQITEASDWYSVGVVLYEALTGLPPFDGTASVIARDKLDRQPLPPITLNADIPEDLSSLCADLLKLQPKDRPSGGEIVRRLGGPEHSVRIPDLRSRTFVGRMPELAVLHQAAAATVGGGATTVHLVGDSGMGKTALIERFLTELSQRADLVVLRGRSYAQESLPYKALDGAIDDLSRHLSRRPSLEVTGMLPRHVLDLACLFPVLRQVESVSGARRKSDDNRSALEIRRHAFGALRELLERIAAERTVVMFLDDVHWGDVDSVQLIHSLMRPPDPPSLLLILAYRADEEPQSAFLRELATLQSATGTPADIRRVVLDRIANEDCEGLVKTLLGRATPPPDFIRRIVREAGGNPLFVEELVRFTSWGEAHTPAPGERAETMFDLTSEERRVLLHGVVQRRLSELPEAWQRLIDVVAVAGQPIDVEAARHAAGLDGVDGTVLNRLRAGHLVRTRQVDGHEQIAPYHDRIRETVVERLGPEALKHVHGAIAESLIRTARTPPAIIANHLRDAGDLDRAAEYAFEAAERAAAALAFGEAAELYRKVLDWKPGDVTHARGLRRKQADALANAGRCADAAPVYLEAASGAARLQSIDLQRLAFEQLLTAGRIDEGMAILRDVCRSVAVSCPPTPTRAVMSLVADFVRLKVRGIGFTERREDQVPAEELLRIDVCYSASRNLILNDPIMATRFNARALVLALSAGEPSRLVEGLAAVGTALTMQNRGDGPRMLEAARGLADRLATPYAQGLLQLWTAYVDYTQGRWAAALDTWDEALALLRQCRGVASEMQKAQCNAIMVVQLLGRFEDLQRRTELAMTDARAAGNRYTEVYARLYSSMARLAAGDVEGARDRIADALARAPAGDHYTRVTALKFECFCDLYEGRAPEGLRRLALAWPGLKASRMMRFSSHFRVVMHALRAGLALETVAHHGGDTRLCAEADSDVGTIAKERTPYAIGRAAQLGAGLALLRGDTDSARVELGRSARAFDGAGLELEAAYSRRWLGRLARGAAAMHMLAEADGVMRGHGVKDPQRWTPCQAPGFPEEKGARDG